MTDGQRDRRTDGIAVASTALAMQALRRAVKMVHCFYAAGGTVLASETLRRAKMLIRCI